MACKMSALKEMYFMIILWLCFACAPFYVSYQIGNWNDECYIIRTFELEFLKITSIMMAHLVFKLIKDLCAL